VDVVFGTSPLALAVTSRLAASGPTALASKAAQLGPWLWRRCDPATAEGVHHALKGANRAVVVMDDDDEVAGLFTLLKPSSVTRGVLVLGPNTAAPKGLERLGNWSTVRIGATWGPQEPLVAAWAARIARGGGVWVPDLGELAIVSTLDAANAVAAALDVSGASWTLIGDDVVRLSDLATAIGEGLGVPARIWRAPLGLAAWRAGVPATAIRRWAPRTPSKPQRYTPGWTPPSLARRAAWLGDPAKFLQDAGKKKR